jgi:hypothetical protein
MKLKLQQQAETWLFHLQWSLRWVVVGFAVYLTAMTLAWVCRPVPILAWLYQTLLAEIR